MREYDNYLEQRTDEYNRGCENYKYEIAQTEHCWTCKNPCDNYLETLSLGDIKELISEEESYLRELKESGYNTLIASSEKRLKALKDYLRK